MHERPVADLWEWLLRASIVAALALLVYLSLSHEVFEPLIAAYQMHRWTWLIARPSLLWVMMGTLMLCIRTILWFRYAPFRPMLSAEAPRLTVVIPAYNEGAMVQQSIDSVAAASYPHDRLEIFVVDDGSTDDTWMHIEAAARRHPELITTVRLPKNQGKRAALATGFRRAKGEFVVTIDSDSAILPTTLLSIVAPFRDAKVGAVAGKVTVLNRSEGMIARMLAVRFVLTFDFLRAAQSTFGTVYCCPGALSAYRVSVIHTVIDRWMAQTFLGSPCSYGEDRALTNFILEQGYNSVYQNTAIVRTMVPTTYSKLCKMLLRWDRSYVREELHFGRIIWHRPLGPMLVALLDCTVTNLRYPVGYASLAVLVSAAFSHPLTLPRVGLAIGLMAAMNMLYYLRSERTWNFVYGILYAYFSFVALFWIFPYAVLTVRSRSWMTR